MDLYFLLISISNSNHECFLRIVGPSGLPYRRLTNLNPARGIWMASHLIIEVDSRLQMPVARRRRLKLSAERQLAVMTLL